MSIQTMVAGGAGVWWAVCHLVKPSMANWKTGSAFSAGSRLIPGTCSTVSVHMPLSVGAAGPRPLPAVAVGRGGCRVSVGW